MAKEENKPNSDNAKKQSDNKEKPIFIPTNEIVIKGLKIDTPNEQPSSEKRKRNEDK